MPEEATAMLEIPQGVLDAAQMNTQEQAAREGVRNLRESGLLKVKQGLTSLDEVLRTTNV